MDKNKKRVIGGIIAIILLIAIVSGTVVYYHSKKIVMDKYFDNSVMSLHFIEGGGAGVGQTESFSLQDFCGNNRKALPLSKYKKITFSNKSFEEGFVAKTLSFKVYSEQSLTLHFKIRVRNYEKEEQYEEYSLNVETKQNKNALVHLPIDMKVNDKLTTLKVGLIVIELMNSEEEVSFTIFGVKLRK